MAVNSEDWSWRFEQDGIVGVIDESKVKEATVHVWQCTDLTKTGCNHIFEIDSTTASGASAETVAKRILKALLRDQDDITIASIAPRVAYWVRHLCPPLYFWMMAKRAKKLNSSSKLD